MADGNTRNQRLEARIAPEALAFVRRAAEIQGRSVSDFVVTAAQEAARRAIQQYQELELSLRDSQAFVAAFLNSAPANDRLRDTVRRYRKATGV